MNWLKRALGLSVNSVHSRMTAGTLVLFGAILAVAIIASALGSEDFSSGAWAIAGALLLMSFIILPATILPSRSQAREVDALMSGKYWARWEYAGDEWERYSEQEWGRTRKGVRVFAMVVIGLGTGLLILLFAVSGGDPAGPITALAITAVLLLVVLWIYLAGRASYNARTREPGTVYIGPRGILQGGYYRPFTTFNLKLEDVTIEKGHPQVMVFKSSSWTRYGTQTTQTRIPIPRRHEHDAEELAWRFRVAR